MIAVYYSPAQHNLKTLNRRFSLDLIRFTPGGISRAELARQMHLSRSAISSIINDLLASDLVREAASGPAAGGRRPILLELNPQRGIVAGIDIGATHVSILIADFATNLLHEREIPFDIRQAPEVSLNLIDACLQESLATLGVGLKNISAIGVGVPGPVIAELGVVSGPPIMPGWDQFPIRSTLEERWGCPVSLNNDAELGALGEWAQGAGRGTRHLVYIKVGTGIGAGFLLDGRIYRGATGSAGEIGHMTIVEDGPRCNCGSRGCLEALAGGQAIARRAQEAVRSGKGTQLAGIKPLTAISGKDVARAAQMGDLVAQEILLKSGAYLGVAIAGLINLVNPSLVVVGGGIAQVGDLLLEPIRQTVSRRSLPSAARSVRITAAVLGRRSSSLGAVVQALSLALDNLAAR